MKKELSEDTKAMELMSQKQHEQELSVKELDEQLLAEGEEFNLFVCMQRARAAINDTGRAFAVLGANLRLMKAHLPRGEFEGALENLNVSPRTARYAMAASRKFPNLQALADFPRATQIALTVLDDEQAAELDETGELKGVGTADEIKEMSYRELQKALRDLKAEKAKLEEEHAKQIEAVENVVRKKESKISELEMEVAGKQPPTKEELAEQSLKEIRKQMIIRFSSMNAELDELNRLLARAQETEGVTVDQLDSLADGVGEFYSLFDDKYQDFNQDMENIRPMKKE